MDPHPESIFHGVHILYDTRSAFRCLPLAVWQRVCKQGSMVTAHSRQDVVAAGACLPTALVLADSHWWVNVSLAHNRARPTHSLAVAWCRLQPAVLLLYPPYIGHQVSGSWCYCWNRELHDADSFINTALICWVFVNFVVSVAFSVSVLPMFFVVIFMLLFYVQMWHGNLSFLRMRAL